MTTQSPAANTSVEVRAHLAVDDDRSPDAELGARGRGEIAVGAHADRDEDDVGGVAERLPVGPDGAHLEPSG